MSDGARSTLHVWFNGERVGDWRHTAATGHALHYAPQWLDSPYCRPLSLSLPLRPSRDPWRGAPVGHYFDNLLPDSERLRQRLRAQVGARSTDSMALLAEAGQDCPGAVRLTRDDRPPPTGTPEAAPELDERALEQLIDALLRPVPSQGLALPRVVLGGAQDKTALIRHRGRWRLPVPGVLSTHIIKLPVERHPDCGYPLAGSLENAWLCQRLAVAFGLPVAPCELWHVGAHKFLAIARDDRQVTASGQVIGLPMEDGCQAFGLPPSMKYQSNGAPDGSALARLLMGSNQAAEDRLALFRLFLVMWLLCAFDGHAKRFRLRLEPGGRYRLAPPLHILSAYPLIGRQAGKLAPEQIRPALGLTAGDADRPWNAMQPGGWLARARDCAVPVAAVEALMADIGTQALQISANMRRSLPAGFPVAVAEPILQGVVHAARVLRTAI